MRLCWWLCLQTHTAFWGYCLCCWNCTRGCLHSGLSLSPWCLRWGSYLLHRWPSIRCPCWLGVYWGDRIRCARGCEKGWRMHIDWCWCWDWCGNWWEWHCWVSPVPSCCWVGGFPAFPPCFHSRSCSAAVGCWCELLRCWGSQQCWRWVWAGRTEWSKYYANSYCQILFVHSVTICYQLRKGYSPWLIL